MTARAELKSLVSLGVNVDTENQFSKSIQKKVFNYVGNFGREGSDSDSIEG